MCGIFAYIGKRFTTDELKAATRALEPRGPDNFRYYVNELPNGYKVFLGFQRLAINDLRETGDQPMFSEDGKKVLIANGEIYNCSTLMRNVLPRSTSDCESIIVAYEECMTIGNFTEAWMLPQDLDGVFAFALYDIARGSIMISRDPIGVRPLFYSAQENVFGAGNPEYIFASEMKAIHALTCAQEMPNASTVQTFPPAHTMTLQFTNTDVPGASQVEMYTDKYWYFPDPRSSVEPRNIVLNRIRDGFTDAVRKRLMSDRPIGCLLSGGLDSSLVAALVQKCMRETNPDFVLNTFSIGMIGATDLEYARMVAEHIGSRHHEVTFTQEEGIAVIPELISVLESFDVTTVRASVGMYLLSKWISENTDIKVVFSGEGADELAQGYIYFHHSPTADAGHEESIRLLTDLHAFDVLRADRTISHFGLEARVPFLDRKFISEYLKIHPSSRHISGDNSHVEKHLIRKAFAEMALIPDEILWRRKEAFSDGISSTDPTRAWHKVLGAHADAEISDLEYDCAVEDENREIMEPYSKEQYYYWKCFRNAYPRRASERQRVLPYIWMPKWMNTMDPSARTLAHY
jgi:asparagine synthase (glutamine-hydrolysing)